MTKRERIEALEREVAALRAEVTRLASLMQMQPVVVPVPYAAPAGPVWSPQWPPAPYITCDDTSVRTLT